MLLQITLTPQSLIYSWKYSSCYLSHSISPLRDPLIWYITSPVSWQELPAGETHHSSLPCWTGCAGGGQWMGEGWTPSQRNLFLPDLPSSNLSWNSFSSSCSGNVCKESWVRTLQATECVEKTGNSMRAKGRRHGDESSTAIRSCTHMLEPPVVSSQASWKGNSQHWPLQGQGHETASINPCRARDTHWAHGPGWRTSHQADTILRTLLSLAEAACC